MDAILVLGANLGPNEKSRPQVLLQFQLQRRLQFQRRKLQLQFQQRTIQLQFQLLNRRIGLVTCLFVSKRTHTLWKKYKTLNFPTPFRLSSYIIFSPTESTIKAHSGIWLTFVRNVLVGGFPRKFQENQGFLENFKRSNSRFN